MSNGIQWQFDEGTLYSYEQADELQKAIEATGMVKESEKGTLPSFCILLVHTRGVFFDPLKVQSLHLKALPDFLSTWKGLSPAEIWTYRRKNISHTLFGQWGRDFSNEGQRLMADPSELPEAMLTDEQKDELARRDSPLA